MRYIDGYKRMIIFDAKIGYEGLVEVHALISEAIEDNQMFIYDIYDYEVQDELISNKNILRKNKRRIL